MALMMVRAASLVAAPPSSDVDQAPVPGPGCRRLQSRCPPHHQDGEWSGEWSMSTIVAAAMSSDTVASSPADGIDAPLPPHLLNWADPTGCLDNGNATPARSRVCPRLAPVRLALQKLHVVLIRLREAGSMDTRNRPTSSSPTDPDSFEVAVCTLLGLRFI